MTLFEALLIAWFMVLAFALLRAHVVFRIRMRAIDIVHAENMRRINGRIACALLDYPMQRDAKGGPSHTRMMLSLGKWRLKSFYPDLARLEA